MQADAREWMDLNMTLTADRFIEALAPAPVVPVLTLDDPAHGAPLGRAFAAGGLAAVEVTLRTPRALEAMQEIKRAAPGLIVGAGTILSAEGARDAAAAGAEFLVTPGATPKLAAAVLATGVLTLPGTATASEALTRVEEGFEIVKFFPAEQAGGAAALKALAGPLPHIRFMPTGSITLEKAPAYLALPNVAAVGGSWLVTAEDLARQDWDAVTARCRQACALGRT